MYFKFQIKLNPSSGIILILGSYILLLQVEQIQAWIVSLNFELYFMKQQNGSFSAAKD